MTGFIQQLFGGANKGDQASFGSAIAAEQAGQKSDQGQQMKLLAASQAKTDEEAAQLNKPGLGRQMLQFQRSGGAGGAATLGG